MSARRKTSHDVADLDALIEDITVDAHDVGEQLVGFECVIGELLDKGRRRYVVSLLDIEAPPDSELARYIAAYRHWAGLDSP